MISGDKLPTYIVRDISSARFLASTVANVDSDVWAADGAARDATNLAASASDMPPAPTLLDDLFDLLRSGILDVNSTFNVASPNKVPDNNTAAFASVESLNCM